jgi:hypothetical protein
MYAGRKPGGRLESPPHVQKWTIESLKMT